MRNGIRDPVAGEDKIIEYWGNRFAANKTAQCIQRAGF